MASRSTLGVLRCSAAVVGVVGLRLTIQALKASGVRRVQHEVLTEP